MVTGWRAFRLGIVAYIIPFMFIFQPSLLLIGDTATVVQSVVTAIVGVIALAGGMQGYFVTESRPLERILLIAAGLTLLYPGLYTDLLGLGLIAAVALVELPRRKALRAGTKGETL